MFKKLMIANRGEIACRVIRTARRLGIQTVAVYSNADQNALHVELADEAILIGDSPASSSYLNVDSVLNACLETGVDALHPGYGFLSENSKFVSALEKAGISFVGPSVHAIEIMGDKIASKRLATRAGVSVIPGYDGIVNDAQEAIERAHEIGYPVMLKASAGGGGKGLRIASDIQGTLEGFERAQSEAISSFGDDRILIEKCILESRHIEIQVIGDRYGNFVYFCERECSIQRRHQKVIEESPSPFVDEDMRRAMGEQALALVKAINYYSVGTVEFIIDSFGKFYFLEMNTRLQVEHPVTEMITQLDLVELMLRVSAGERLPFSQDEIAIQGWAVEARIYAEDPFREFLPEAGRLSSYREPPPSSSVRIDTGVREGDEVSIHYDPMLAKVITHGHSRDEAIDTMSTALDQFCIQGISTNIPFIAQTVRNYRFIQGRLSTEFFREEYPDGFVGGVLGHDDQLRLVGLAAVLDWYEYEKHKQLLADSVINRIVRIKDDLWKTQCTYTGLGFYVQIDNVRFAVVIESYNRQVQAIFKIDGKTYHASVRRTSFRYQIFFAGVETEVTVLPSEVDALYGLMLTKEISYKSNFVLAPMAGLLVSLFVKLGQEVRSGDQLAVIEAMKMENSLRTTHDAIISKILVTKGQTVEKDQLMIELK